MKNSKKFFGVILSTVLFLAGCGSNANGSGSSTNSGNSGDKTVNIPIEERFTVVDATYTEGTEVQVQLKIQNNTDEDYEMVSFQFFSYDKNGDKLSGHYLSVSDLEANHSTWTSNISTDAVLDEFGSIKIDNYNIQEWASSSSVKTIESVRLSPKPEIKLENMREKK